jgi:hypothetical protein
MIRQLLATLALIAAFAVIAVVLAAQLPSTDEMPLGPHILLLSADEPGLAPVEAAVQGFRDAGFSVTDDASRVLKRLTDNGSDVTVFAVTRQARDEIPDGVYRDLYGSGVVLVALDVAMRELTPAAIGYEIGTGALPYTPGTPVFTLLRTNCSGSGEMSDWLRNWPKIASVAISRSRDHCE